MHGVAMRIGEDLHFDVARPLQIALDQHAVVAEGGGCFLPRRVQRGGEIGSVGHDPHAAAAAAGDRLDHHREADARRLVSEKIRLLPLTMIAGQQRHVGLRHQRLGGGLRSHGTHRRWRRPDEDDAGGGAGFGEGRILRQEAVAGMDRLGARGLCGVDDTGDVQVAVARRRGRRSDRRDRRRTRATRSASASEIDRDRFDAEAPCGAGDAAGDFAAVGDQQGAEHRGHIRNTPKRVSSRGLFSAADSARPSTRRLSAGSMMPSSHSRALA